MTYSTIVSRGSGTYALLLAITGWPYSFVTRASMAPGPDGDRLVGLKTDGIKFEERIDPISGKFTVSGLQLQIADVNEAVTLAFAQRPTQTTYLTSTHTSAVTTLNVTSTVGFASAGTLWVNSECITYTGTTATTFTGCSRGKIGTTAQYHYVDYDAGLRFPEITNYPRLMRGRRVRLYLYGAGDDLQGSGTQIWLGTVAAEPAYNGTTWTLMVDPITSILDQEVFGDISSPTRPRGIYFPDYDPLAFNIHEMTSTTSYYAGGTPAAYSPIQVRLAGSWETQDAFCVAVQSAIDTALTTAGASSKLRIISDGPEGYHFEVQTAAASPKAMTISPVSPISTEPRFATAGFGEGAAALTTSTGVLVNTVSASTEYYIRGDPSYVRGDVTYDGLGTVPRGVFIASRGGMDATTSSTPDHTILLGGVTAIPSYTDSVLIKWGDDEFEYGVRLITAASRKIKLTDSIVAGTGPRSFTAAQLPEIRLGRSFNAAFGAATNSIADVLSKLITNAAQYANAGAQPFLESGDFDISVWTAAYAGMPRFLNDRYFNFYSPVTLAAMVTAELQMAGYFMALDSSGRMVIKPLRLPLSTDASAATITKSDLLTDEGFPTYERAGLGLINTVVVKTGYSASGDEWTGPDVIVRDVPAFGESPTARRLLIEPRSQETWGTPAEHLLDMTGAAQRQLGLFAAPYAACQLSVSLKYLATATVGSTLRITSVHIPDDAGTKGVTLRPGLVIGREVDLEGARINLTLILSSARIGGYAPGTTVASQTNVSGDTWDITLNTTYFPTGTEADDWYAASDKVRVHLYDSTTTGEVTGTVVSATGNVVRVTFDSAWVPGATTWILSFGKTNSPQQTSQRVFAGVADNAARLTYDSTDDKSAFQYTA